MCISEERTTNMEGHRNSQGERGFKREKLPTSFFQMVGRMCIASFHWDMNQ
jgi:hypothetical protein